MKSFIVATLMLLCASARAVSIPTVPVGNAGNPADSTGYGAVAYDYRIGTTEVTTAQYVEFLNAVASTDPYELYHPYMTLTSYGGIMRSGTVGNYTYSVKADAVGSGPGGTDYTYANKPVTYASWGDAARFANWMHNGQPTGEANANTTEDGAYTLNGAATDAALYGITRNAGATWFIPTENEWYKAAYYDGSTYYDYATGTDSIPNHNLPSSDTGNSVNFRVDYDGGYTTGDADFPLIDAGAYTLSTSHYGTFDQSGSMWEYNEAMVSGTFRGYRGGSWRDTWEIIRASVRRSGGATGQAPNVGFRLGTIPEPSTYALAAIGIATLLAMKRRKR